MGDKVFYAVNKIGLFFCRPEPFLCQSRSEVFVFVEIAFETLLISVSDYFCAVLIGIREDKM